MTVVSRPRPYGLLCPHGLVCIFRTRRIRAVFHALDDFCYSITRWPWRKHDPMKLHVAIKDGNINLVRDILRARKSLVYSRDRQGRNALHWTVVLGTMMCTKLVLRKISWWLIDRCDYNGCTPLHYASQADRSDEARLLLNRGAYVNARDDHGRTPAHYAALNGNPFILHKLHTHGANFWIRDIDGYFCIDLAENPEIIEMLNRLMDQNFKCFRLFAGTCSKEMRSTSEAPDRYPYHEDGNPVRRYLPKYMLHDKMSHDGTRNKHDLIHLEQERYRMSNMDTDAQTYAKERALDDLVLRMQHMKEEDQKRESRRVLVKRPVKRQAGR